MDNAQANFPCGYHLPIHFQARGKYWRAITIRRLNQNRSDECSWLGAVGSNRVQQTHPERLSGGYLFAIGAYRLRGNQCQQGKTEAGRKAPYPANRETCLTATLAKHIL